MIGYLQVVAVVSSAFEEFLKEVGAFEGQEPGGCVEVQCAALGAVVKAWVGFVECKRDQGEGEEAGEERTGWAGADYRYVGGGYSYWLRK